MMSFIILALSVYISFKIVSDLSTVSSVRVGQILAIVIASYYGGGLLGIYLKIEFGIDIVCVALGIVLIYLMDLHRVEKHVRLLMERFSKNPVEFLRRYLEQTPKEDCPKFIRALVDELQRDERYSQWLSGQAETENVNILKSGPPEERKKQILSGIMRMFQRAKLKAPQGSQTAGFTRAELAWAAEELIQEENTIDAKLLLATIYSFVTLHFGDFLIVKKPIEKGSLT